MAAELLTRGQPGGQEEAPSFSFLILPLLAPLFFFFNILNYIYGYAAAAAAKSLQSCPTLCDPIDDSPPGSAISGILQTRTLEWFAISFSNTGK